MIIIKWYMDSGASIHSRKRGEISVEELGFTDEEWQDMDETEKEDCVKEVAWESLDWGWEEEEG